MGLSVIDQASLEFIIILSQSKVPEIIGLQAYTHPHAHL